jgi:hypothetical protein
MSIIRVRKHTQFVSINMAVLADLSLSWEAKGLHVYLLSRVDHWQVSVTHLARSNRHAGRDKIYRMLRELIEHGYAQRILVRTPSGRIAQYDYEVFENKQTNSTSKPKSVDNCVPLPEKPFTAEPYTAKPTLANKDKKLLLNSASTSTGGKPIAHSWRPSETVWTTLKAKRIDIDFAELMIPEFILYWSERDPVAGNWDSRFIGHMIYLEDHPGDSQNLARPHRN